MPTAWHPSRYQDWRMSEDEKKEMEKLWALTQAFIVPGDQTQKFFDPKRTTNKDVFRHAIFF